MAYRRRRRAQEAAQHQDAETLAATPVTPYDYRIVSVDRVVDGDTMWVTVDVGFYVTCRADIRLARINAPEMSTPEGRPARDFVVNWLVGRDLRVTTAKTDTWKRWLGEVYDASTHENLSDTLLASGMAVLYKP